MSGTYLICDFCGNPGPPAAFLFQQGTRICYVCAEAAAQAEQPAVQPQANDDHRNPKQERRDTDTEGT
ncbi:MAG: hypothetical protein H6970_04670 [Gammaproteobacteria bacterium]|nr:hypothetical protein [Gammaproteobacteria bacterium]MCP5424342.1 hypothetical protein [Gammaproteobacteria bacterium]MCP5459096.1 hypothetical protein [Gammaproteobacteria bacterium]